MNLNACVVTHFKEASDLVSDDRINTTLESIESDLKNIWHHLAKSPVVRPKDDIVRLFVSIRSAADSMSRRLGK